MIKVIENKRFPENWKDLIEIEISIKGNDATFNVQFTKGKTPRKFIRYIGSLNLVRLFSSEFNQFVWFVEKSELEDCFQGIGLGKFLYETALNRVGNLMTGYFDASPQAKNLWKSLSKKYKYQNDFFSGKLLMFNEKK